MELNQAKRLKTLIRNYEKTHGIEPANIQIHDDGAVSISIKKNVLYQYDKNKHSWFRTFRANDGLDCDKHTKTINTIESTIEKPGVEVARQYKTFPIPFFNIPIKIPGTSIGWHKVGTRIRGYNNLANQPAIITLNFSSETVKNNEQHKNILKFVEEAASISENNENDHLPPSATKRKSNNPIKKFFRWCSKCIDKNTLGWLPNGIKKMARPYPHGYKNAQYHLDTPYINGGLMAHAIVNTGIMLFSLVGSCACLPCDTFAHGRANDSNKTATDNGRIQPSKDGHFAQTCVKIKLNDHPQNINNILDNNIENTIS